MSTSFSVIIDDVNSTSLSYHSLITADVLAATQLLAQYLVGNASIEIKVVIDQVSNNRGNGGSATTVFLRHDGAFDIYAQGFAGELLTGLDPNGSLPDVIITLDPDYISNELWFDQNPTSQNPSIPSNRTDAVSVFLHELGHALAFNGWRDYSTGALPANYESTFDEQISLVNGQPYFVGASAEAVYGGPIGLTLGNIMHYGNAGGPSSDLLPLGCTRQGVRDQRVEVTARRLVFWSSPSRSDDAAAFAQPSYDPFEKISLLSIRVCTTYSAIYCHRDLGVSTRLGDRAANHSISQQLDNRPTASG